MSHPDSKRPNQSFERSVKAVRPSQTSTHSWSESVLNDSSDFITCGFDARNLSSRNLSTGLELSTKLFSDSKMEQRQSNRLSNSFLPPEIFPVLSSVSILCQSFESVVFSRGDKLTTGSGFSLKLLALYIGASRSLRCFRCLCRSKTIDGFPASCSWFHWTAGTWQLFWKPIYVAKHNHWLCIECPDKSSEILHQVPPNSWHFPRFNNERNNASLAPLWSRSKKPWREFCCPWNVLVSGRS